MLTTISLFELNLVVMSVRSMDLQFAPLAADAGMAEHQVQQCDWNELWREMLCSLLSLASCFLQLHVGAYRT